MSAVGAGPNTQQADDMGPLQRSSLRGDAARVIRAQIITGKVKAGRLYSIGEIATELGTSPTPVREALLELSKQSLIEMVRNRGFRVREVSDEELDHLVDVRVMLEVPAIERLAARRPVPNLDDVRAYCGAIEQAAERGDLTTFLAVDRDLHLALIAKLGNNVLTTLVGDLRDRSRLYGLGRILNTPEMTTSAREHTEILEAVQAGDPAQASALLRHHLNHIRKDWSG